MAQLSHEKDKLPTLDETIALIAQKFPPLNLQETVPLLEALGKILASDIFAPLSLPSFNNSAVDGYAINYNAFKPVMPLAGRISAGFSSTENHQTHHAIRIFTGAPLPDSFDTVFMQEDVKVDGDFITLPQGLKRGSNARLIGEDIYENSIALNKGITLTPQDLTLLAALGITEVPVVSKLRVGIFSTGNEITELGEPLKPASIYDANRTLLSSLLHKHHVIDLGILPDNLDKTRQALENASEKCDLLITSGGVSTGEEDHIKKAISLEFWKLGIKPGRPVAMGKVNQTHFIGLPGNPVAVFVTFAYIVKPILAALQGAIYTPPLSFEVSIGFNYTKKRDRREYVRVNLNNTIAHKFEQDGAGVITSLTKTDGLLELLEGQTEIKKGDRVRFIPYALLL